MEPNKLVVRRKKLKGEDGFKTFSVRIREDIVKRIEEISDETNRSRNELIGMFLEFALEQCVIEDENASQKHERTPAFQSSFNREFRK